MGSRARRIGRYRSRRASPLKKTPCRAQAPDHMRVTRSRDADEREHGDDDDDEADKIDEVVHGGAPLLLLREGTPLPIFRARRLTKA